MTLRTCALVMAAAVLLGAPAGCASTAAAPAALCGMQTLPVSGGEYTIQNNEWGSSARECVTTGGGTGFTVARSAIAIATNATAGAPGGYPSIYKGCHWSACTAGSSGLPVPVAGIQPGTVTTSWRTSQPGGSSIYNVSYDIWFNREPAFTGKPDGTELMIWLNSSGPVHPTGHLAAAGVPAGGRGYDVWVGRRSGWHAITYEMISSTTSVSDLDLQPFVADAMSRGYLRNSWYLTGVEAGFEIWQGGAGLATRSFSVTVAGGG